MVNGQRIRVIQRKFLSFPQRVALMVIPLLCDLKGGWWTATGPSVLRAKAASILRNYKVKAVPAQFTGGTLKRPLWRWNCLKTGQPRENLKQGDSVADHPLTGLGPGLCDSDINTGTPTGIKVYRAGSTKSKPGAGWR